jgi:hypothetical protein
MFIISGYVCVGVILIISELICIEIIMNISKYKGQQVKKPALSTQHRFTLPSSRVTPLKSQRLQAWRDAIAK